MKSEYIYPAVFHLNRDDGSYTITFPDLPGCISEGKSLGNAITMAASALAEWISYLLDKGEDIPEPGDLSGISINPDEFVNFVRADIKDNRAVRRTVSIPKWMDEEVSKQGLSLSKVLQDTLKEKFTA
ncbi:type II toxin-antitoxin system HicB family antitoxin [Clostridium vitabionis]|jgi:predicted RNase H-like HicB family nuclease|uniref:type II toxin-antitoxin system HicB family antitoxin n=1 Tax=Clostridium vitabionis TaxID=2784388 RepID=UPI00188A4853|nr:type II toxin-antitoxin system HicB family antitoxin [Clostridium vitabionis]